MFNFEFLYTKKLQINCYVRYVLKDYLYENRGNRKIRRLKVSHRNPLLPKI